MIEKTEGKIPKRHVGAKIDHALYEELIRLKESSGKNESQLLNEALSAYLGVDAAATVPDRVSRLEMTMTELQEQSGIILEKFKRLAID